MKLSAEEIRKRGNDLFNLAFERAKFQEAVLKFAEDLTGEKIPEPFDESRVVHGSVWGFFGLKFVLIGDRDSMLYCYRDGSLGDRYTRAHIIKKFAADRAYKFLGTYDFTAGLPEGAK